MKPRLAAFALAFILALGASAQTPREAHGSSDVYAERGVAIAWAVLRGANEADTSIVIRVALDPSVFRGLAVAGVNPFSHAEQPLAAREAAGSVDAQVPRARFAELPRTEIRLYATAAAAQSGPPALIVYYLGVPDTTPEFADRTKLDGYLRERIARARSDAPKGTP
jgi:hypothetical protein